MSQDSQKLFAQFPKLFDLQGQNPVSAYGIEIFETSKGWTNLVFELCGELQEYVNLSGCRQVKILTLKSKFASLRCYLGNFPSEVGYAGDIQNIINKYVELSFKTCESCGTSDPKAKVTQNKTNWILTLCESCRKPSKT